VRISNCFLAVVATVIASASSAFGDITIGDINRTITISISGNTHSDTSTGLFPTGITQTLQDAITIAPQDPFTVGSQSSTFAQQITAFTYESGEFLGEPSGRSYDFSVESKTAIAHNPGGTDTTAGTSTTIVFTLDTPTAWSLNEQVIANGPDFTFAGAELFAGEPQTFNVNNSLLPNIGQFPQNGGPISGVLAPGTYTFVVQAGTDDDYDTEAPDVTADFALTEVPEPVIAFPLFVGAFALIRRR
jgi:hypothetical protein